MGRTFYGLADEVRSLELTDELVVRPEGFDLAEAWKMIASAVDEWRAPVKARALVSLDHLSLVRWVFGNRVRIGPARPDGRVEVELRSASGRALAGEIAGFGDSVEVLEPEEIRGHLGDIANELSGIYQRPLSPRPKNSGHQ